MNDKAPNGNAGGPRAALGRDICGSLKTMVLGARLFPPGHATVASYFGRFQRFVREFLDREGPLTIEVSSMGLHVDGQLVLAAEEKQPLISDPIFRDGVTEISFAVDTPVEELAQLCEIWSTSMVIDTETAQTFTTRCWEASFNSIRVVSVDNFVEYLSEDAERELNEILLAIDAERARGPHLPAPPPQPPRLGPQDAPRLRASGLRELDAADLEARGAAPVLAGPTAEEAQAIAAAVEAERTRQSVPAITALSFAGMEATPADRAEVVAGLGAVFVSIARASGLEQVRQTVTAFVDAARTDSDGPQRRYSALPLVLDGLGTPVLLSLCVAAITGPALDATLEGIFAFLQPGAAPALLDCITPAPQPVGELLLPRLLGLKPEPEALRSRVARLPIWLALPLLDYAKAFPEADRTAVYIAAIPHSHADVRHYAAARVPREVLVQRPESLFPLVNDGDPNLRQLALSALLSTNDVSAVPWLVKMLDNPDLHLAERRRVIRSLGSIPTRESVTALRKEFRTQPNAETSATCAIALGRAGDEYSRPALDQVVGKRLISPDLKQACVEALRMLDARRSLGESTATRRQERA